MGFWFHFAQAARLVFWLLLSGLLLIQVFGRGDTTQKKRDLLLDQFQSERKSRVIALIHRQESVSILGVPVSSYINIEDSEAVLRAIRLTPDDQPITVQLARQLGLPVTTEMPRIVYELMDLYPQANARRPSVVYVPMRGLGEGKGEPVVPGPTDPNPAPGK